MYIDEIGDNSHPILAFLAFSQRVDVNAGDFPTAVVITVLPADQAGVWVINGSLQVGVYCRRAPLADFEAEECPHGPLDPRAKNSPACYIGKPEPL